MVWWTTSKTLTFYCNPWREKVDVRCSSRHSSVADRWWRWARCSTEWRRKFLLLLPDSGPHRRDQSKTLEVSESHVGTIASYLQLLHPVICQTVWVREVEQVSATLWFHSITILALTFHLLFFFISLYIFTIVFYITNKMYIQTHYLGNITFDDFNCCRQWCPFHLCLILSCAM